METPQKKMKGAVKEGPGENAKMLEKLSKEGLQEMKGKEESAGDLDIERQDADDIVKGVLSGALGVGRVFQSNKDFLKYMAHVRAAVEDDGDPDNTYWGYSQVEAEAKEDALELKRRAKDACSASSVVQNEASSSSSSFNVS